MQGKEDDDEQVSRDGSPVDEGIEAVGGGAPLGGGEGNVDQDNRRACIDEGRSYFCGDAGPKDTQQDDCKQQ